jgi:hypothetical protein
VSRNDNPTWSAWVFEHIVVATVTFGPSIPFKSRHNFRPVRFGLSHRSLRRKYWRILFCQSTYANTGA